MVHVAEVWKTSRFSPVTDMPEGPLLLPTSAFHCPIPMLRFALILSTLAVPGSFTGTLQAAGWPDFRGPFQNGHAPAEAAPPLTWSEQEHVVWKTPIHGKGWSSPIILGDQVWITTATEDGTEQSALCVDRATGEILFDRVLFRNAEPRPLGNNRNTYASPSPVIDESHAWVHFGSYGTACLDRETFEVKWSTTEYPCHHWRGPASSPVLHEDLIILTFDGADLQYLVGLDKDTGAEVWRRDRSTDFDDLTVDGTPARDGDFRKAFNTPILVKHEGATQLISPGAKAAWSYDPWTGAENWSVHWNEHSSASRTVFSEDLGLLYLNTGYGKSEVWAVRFAPEAEGEISDSHVAWKATKRMPNRVSPIVHEGLLYVLSDQGVATCLDAATGEEVWSERISEMPFSASLLFANGHLFFFDEGGKTIVIRPGRSFDKVAENQLNDGFYASPAVVGDALYLRTTTHLYRIEAAP